MARSAIRSATPICPAPSAASRWPPSTTAPTTSELDTCRSEHGFWLDAGEEGRVRDIIDERVRGLQRSATAEAAWGNFLDGLGGRGGGGAWGSVRRFFGGGRR